MSLPVAEQDVVIAAQSEFEQQFRDGSTEELEAARFRFVWALAHGPHNPQVERGLKMAKQRLEEFGYPDKMQKDLSEEKARQLQEYLYLAAVAAYKLRKYVEARSDLKYVLQSRPGHRQAESLGKVVDEALVQEGLIGLGAVFGLAGVALAVLLCPIVKQAAMNYIRKLTSCFALMDEPSLKPFSASMANLYDPLPLQITIGTIPSPGAPFKVVFQNIASSTYFGPLVCPTQETPPFAEAFLWEQLLGTSGSKGWEEQVAEMIQVVQIGEEWTQAVPLVTLVTPHPVAKGMMSKHAQHSMDFYPKDRAQNRGQDRVQDLGEDPGRHEVDPNMDNLALLELPCTSSIDRKETYSVMQLIKVTARSWSFPKHVIDYMCGDSEEQGKTYGSLARSHKEVTILFMDIVGFRNMSKMVASAAVHKVETAGDCYIVSCGIMERDDKDGFAKDILRISKMVNMPHDNKPVIIRIGIHTGSVVSGVIGTKLPKFSVFGDTMNTASRMESTANHGGIQVSEDTFNLLHSAGNTDSWKSTGGIEGKGIMETFHIQMHKEAFDVKAIKRDYKDEIEKADGTMGNPSQPHGGAMSVLAMMSVLATDEMLTVSSVRSLDGHLMAVAEISAARFNPVSRLPPASSLLPLSRISRPLPIPASRLSPFISRPLPIPTTNSRLLLRTSSSLLTKSKSSTASAAALNDLLLIGFRGPMSTGNFSTSQPPN
eukprot:gene19839-26530_t